MCRVEASMARFGSSRFFKKKRKRKKKKQTIKKEFRNKKKYLHNLVRKTRNKSDEKGPISNSYLTKKILNDNGIQYVFMYPICSHNNRFGVS